MNAFLIKLDLVGLVGPYTSYVVVKAKNEKSALKKGEKFIGNRDCVGSSVLSKGEINKDKTYPHSLARGYSFGEEFSD